MWQISKDFKFSASHQLIGLPEGHQCGRVHGHNYIVRVTLASNRLDSHGFVLDYGELKPFSTWIDETLDHRHLNDVIDLQPSAELIAVHLAAMVRRLAPLPPRCTVKVAVSETPNTWAEYSEGAPR